MEPGHIPVANEFESLLRGWFVAAREPSPEILAARQTVGDLSIDEHVVASPSPLLVGQEIDARQIKMSVRLAMVINETWLNRFTIRPMSAKRPEQLPCARTIAEGSDSVSNGPDAIWSSWGSRRR